MPPRLSEGISLAGNGTDIRLVPVIPTQAMGALNLPQSRTAMNLTTSEAVRINDNKIQYRYDEKTTIEYSLTYTGFKEDIVVSEYTGQTIYPFRLYTNGLALSKIRDSYYLVDGKGTIEASIGDIIIFTADERNNACGEIVPLMVKENEEYILNIVVDKEYLSDPNTAYPIRIDPTIELNYDNNGASAIEDITISTNTNFSGSHTSLYIGRRSTEGVARALMRFPGVDLSDLAGANVTSATVRMRDLMCESTALTVYCYPFTGAAWSADSATWSAVSPNSYGPLLSSQTMSWSNGKLVSPVHWYTFDITAAVQGWIDGNYSQNKGIIFKVDSAVENGSVIENRTVGSYNRTSYKPTLSITYTSAGSQLLTNGTYYVNNTNTGKYIQYTSSSYVSGMSGLLSNLGTSIQRELRKVSGGYVIRAVNDPTKYLAGASNTASSNVSVETVSESAIPSRCVWTISVTSGGCLIQNTYSGRYLYMTGSSLYTAEILGTVGTTEYETRVWRVASTSYYGNSSAYTFQELTSGFSFNNLIVNIGASKVPTLNKTPVGAFWSNVSDFTFTYSSGTSGAATVNLQQNSFSGVKAGITTYTATHKVTGRHVTFKLYVDRYTYELTNEFGFNDTEALLIRSVYDKIDSVYPNESLAKRGWRGSRLLSSFVYEGPIWNEVAGVVVDINNIQDYFCNTLGYTTSEYSQIEAAVTGKHNNPSVISDFAHFSYSMAARFAYSLDLEGIAGSIGSEFLGEDVSYWAGWLGDATLTENEASTTFFANDDYHADLDAENIYRLVMQGFSILNASNTYYGSLSATNTRADVFLSYISYETVESKIYMILVDIPLGLMLSSIDEEEEPDLYNYYESLLSDEQYHIDVVKSYPDTYNFMCSVRDRRADIANYL